MPYCCDCKYYSKTRYDGSWCRLKKKSVSYLDSDKDCFEGPKTGPKTTETTPALKHCKKCGRDLPLEMFSPNKNSKSGFSSICKDCKAELGRQAIAKRHEKKAKEPKEFVAPEIPDDVCKALIKRKAISISGQIIKVEIPPVFPSGNVLELVTYGEITFQALKSDIIRIAGLVGAQITLSLEVQEGGVK